MSNLKTTYSMTFDEYVNIDKAWYSDNLIMSTDSRTKAFKDMLYSTWNIYEISAETIQEFRLFLSSVFNEYVAYYEELLADYEKKIDFQEGITTVMNSKTNGVNKVLNVELPNKQLSNDVFDYPNTANKDDTDTTTKTEYTNKANFNSLKRESMQMIRNIYLDFAMRFKDCFVHVF